MHINRFAVLIALTTILLILGLLGHLPALAAPADSVVGDGTAASCDGNALEAAIMAGGSVTFDCGGAHTILANTMVVDSGLNVVVDGGGLITVSGEELRQLFIVNAGASLTLTRNPDYWGRDLPVNRGLWNFDEIRLDFYREANGAFEAFKRGLYDFRVENEPLRWHDGYDFAAARSGEVIRDYPRLPEGSEV